MPSFFRIPRGSLLKKAAFLLAALVTVVKGEDVSFCFVITSKIKIPEDLIERYMPEIPAHLQNKADEKYAFAGSQKTFDNHMKAIIEGHAWHLYKEDCDRDFKFAPGTALLALDNTSLIWTRDFRVYGDGVRLQPDPDNLLTLLQYLPKPPGLGYEMSSSALILLKTHYQKMFYTANNAGFDLFLVKKQRDQLNTTNKILGAELTTTKEERSSAQADAVFYKKISLILFLVLIAAGIAAIYRKFSQQQPEPARVFPDVDVIELPAPPEPQEFDNPAPAVVRNNEEAVVVPNNGAAVVVPNNGAAVAQRAEGEPLRPVFRVFRDRAEGEPEPAAQMAVPAPDPVLDPGIEIKVADPDNAGDQQSEQQLRRRNVP